MSPNFVRLADLLRVEGNEPYKELVTALRMRFPGRGHAFDTFIEQLTPLATGFLAVPPLSEPGRSAKIRSWLNEAAQGRGQHFKPILLRWFWTYDEPWMREYVYRWSSALGLTEAQFGLPALDDATHLPTQRPDILIAYASGTDMRSLIEIADRLKGKGIIVHLLELTDKLGQLAAHIAQLGDRCISVLYSNSLSRAYRTHNGKLLFQDAESVQASAFFIDQSKRLIVLKEEGEDIVTPLKKAMVLPYLEMLAGMAAVLLSLEQAVAKAREGDHAFLRFYYALAEKNAGQEFLERGLEEKSRLKPDGISVTLFDIDMTNQINRRFGDDIGDLVIAEIQSFLAGSLLEIDSDFGRCGDDTFYATVYNDFNQEGFMGSLLEKIRNLEEWKDVPDLRVTCSAGYAARRPKEAMRDVVVKAAIGLDNARKAGGDRLMPGPDRIPNATSRYIRHHFS